jgi:periplasmic protein TonB
MIYNRLEVWKTRLAGGAAALAIQVGFGSLLLYGLAVSYAPSQPQPTAITNYPTEPVVEPPKPEPAKPLETLKPDDMRPPIFNDQPVLKTDRLQDSVTKMLVDTDIGIKEPQGTHPQPPIIPDAPPQVIRTTAGIDPRYAGALQPNYPAAARRADMEGKVLLRVLVGIDGRVKQAEVKTSSGHDVLDKAAAEHALKKWRFKPATEDGQAVEAWLVVPVTFELKQG